MFLSSMFTYPTVTTVDCEDVVVLDDLILDANGNADFVSCFKLTFTYLYFVFIIDF